MEISANDTRSIEPGKITTTWLTDYMKSYIATACKASKVGDDNVASSNKSGGDMCDKSSRTELDSHANMAVVGMNAYILNNTGATAEVNAFTPDHAALVIEIVDAAVQYDCPYTGTTYVLVIRNALHVPSMQHNLIPPFMIREAGIVVNDTPKIQVDDPSTADHSIYFPGEDFRIPLSLWGVFSYFPTSKPSVDTLNACDEVFLLTPTRWDPHSSSYAQNEECMLD